MSTAVVLNLPEAGHMNATLPVVAELVRRGETILYYGTPAYREAIVATGATFVPYPALDFTPPAHAGGLYSVMAFLTDLAEQVLPPLLDQLRAQRPDYLLVDSMCIWGNLAQQVLETPAVTLGSVFVPNPQYLTSEQMATMAYAHAPKEVLLAGIAALDRVIQTTRRIDRQHGTLSPNLVEFFANRQRLAIIFTSRLFHLDGDRFDDRYKFVGPSLPPAPVAARSEGDPVLPLGDQGPPWIYVSLGTIFNQQAAFYRTCFAALGGSRFRVLLASGDKIDRAELGPLPENFIVRPRVPQLEVLPRVALFITHGGMNSVNEALYHGVPLLVVPQHGDQHLVAGRVAELGAGLQLAMAEVSPERLRQSVDRLLAESSFRAAALRVSASLREAGGYPRAAQEILTFARGLCT
jgi:MGT family glycosyltransferase